MQNLEVLIMWSTVFLVSPEFVVFCLVFERVTANSFLIFKNQRYQIAVKKLHNLKHSIQEENFLKITSQLLSFWVAGIFIL